jgi:SPP1 family predicted phage head-tail adaptor
MNVGALRRRVRLLEKTTVSDGYGGRTETWVTLRDVWAARRPLRGRELIQALAVESDVSALFTVRYASDITAALRLRDGTTDYEVVSATADERNWQMELLCRVVR